jgi:hypothetical protein
VKKSKYDIKTKPLSLSDKDIEKHMDFDKTYAHYSHWAYRKPWHRFQRHAHKNYRIVLYLILIAVIAALVLMEMG